MQQLFPVPRFIAPYFGAFLVLSMALVAPGYAQDDDDDEDVDDILAPLDEEESKSKEQVLQIGLMPLVPIGSADQALAAQVMDGLSREFKDQAFVIEELAVEVSTGPAKKVNTKMGQKELARANKNLKRAEKLMKRMKFGRAQKYYQKALDDFEKAPAALDDLTPVINTYLGLAEGYARQGMEEETLEVIGALSAMHPEIELDDERFPPQFIRTFAKKLKQVMHQERAELTVDATARGALIQLDGRDVGNAPLKITDVPAGKHYLRVFLDGVGLHGELIELEPGQSLTVTPGFIENVEAGPKERLVTNQFDDDVAAMVADAAKDAGYLGALVGVVSKTRATVPTALIYVDADSKMVRHLDVLEFDADLLNMAIESLKASEEVQKAIQSKKFSAVDDEPLIEGVEVAAEETIDEIGLRFEVKLDYKETRKKKKKRKKRRKRNDDSASRAIGSDADELEDDEDSRALASGGGRSNRRTLRDDSGDPLRRRRSTTGRTELIGKEEKSIWAQPLLWVGVAAGGAVAVTVIGGGALGATYLIMPPSVGSAQVVLPE